MMRPSKARGLAGVGLVLAALFSFASPLKAQQPCGDCAPHCQKFHCPPHLKHCAEGPPHICFERGCPKPICCPCNMPNWGYYQTCWTPWPWPPDWSHCPVQPPASSVIIVPGATIAPPVGVEELPEPRRRGF
jgi:hypothetical protein